MQTSDIDVASYKTFVFDCDGVILNSNHIKTEAFYNSALSYGNKAAEDFVEYHTQNGGVSRYKKFQHFLEKIVPGQSGPNRDELLAGYAEEVTSELKKCEIAEGISQLRDKTAKSRWLVVSGGSQDELRNVFKDRGISDLFDGGIFGSPDTKELILNREITNGNILEPALFIGDSKYDWVASQSSNLDFVFASEWTEVTDWRTWIIREKIRHVGSLRSLL